MSDASSVEANAQLKTKFQLMHNDAISLDLSSAVDELFSVSVISLSQADELLHGDGCCSCGARRRQLAQRLLLMLHGCGHPQAFVALRTTIAKEASHKWFVDKLDRLEPPPPPTPTIVVMQPTDEDSLEGSDGISEVAAVGGACGGGKEIGGGGGGQARVRPKLKRQNAVDFGGEVDAIGRNCAVCVSSS